MPITKAYLDKMLRAIRLRNANADICTEVTDLVGEARADLVAMGVMQSKVEDETDPLILGAVRSFVRWKMATDESEAGANMNDYMTQRDELRRRTGYIGGVLP